MQDAWRERRFLFSQGSKEGKLFLHAGCHNSNIYKNSELTDWWELYQKNKTMGIIEVDMFSDDVDSPYHPEAIQLKYLLEEVAEEYKCELLSFQVSQGTVSFSFDSDELTAEILKILQYKKQVEWLYPDLENLSAPPRAIFEFIIESHAPLDVVMFKRLCLKG